MSEQVTAKRLWAARTARRFPVVLEMVERGELHLGAIHLLARHLRSDNHVRLLERARHKSSREVERLVAENAPRADVTSRIRALAEPRVAGATLERPAATVSLDAEAGGACQRPSAEHGDRTVCAGDAQILRTPQPRTAGKPLIPLSPRRYKLEITIDEATHDKLRSLQDLLGRSATGRDPASIVSRAIDVLLVRTLAGKAGSTDRPKQPREAAPMDGSACVTRADAAGSRNGHRSRYIAAAVRREVWRRDCGRCCYVDLRGRRCGETSKVDFHHTKPFATGGRQTPENIELRCAAHNQFQADLDFGRSFMDSRRSSGVAA